MAVDRHARAHLQSLVKQRALCSDDEKRDPTNVLVACVLCDIAFERGWIAPDDNQQIIVSTTLPATTPLRQRLEHVGGRGVSRELNAEAVTFHRQHSFVP